MRRIHEDHGVSKEFKPLHLAKTTVLSIPCTLRRSMAIRAHGRPGHVPLRKYHDDDRGLCIHEDHSLLLDRHTDQFLLHVPTDIVAYPARSKTALQKARRDWQADATGPSPPLDHLSQAIFRIQSPHDSFHPAQRMSRNPISSSFAHSHSPRCHPEWPSPLAHCSLQSMR